MVNCSLVAWQNDTSVPKLSNLTGFSEKSFKVSCLLVNERTKNLGYVRSIGLEKENLKKFQFKLKIVLDWCLKVKIKGANFKNGNIKLKYFL